MVTCHSSARFAVHVTDCRYPLAIRIIPDRHRDRPRRRSVGLGVSVRASARRFGRSAASEPDERRSTPITQSTADSNRLKRIPKILDAGIDAQPLEEDAAERVHRDVERERLALLQPAASFEPHDRARTRAGTRSTRRETSDGTSSRCRRSPRRSVRGVDLERPRQLGRAAEQLLVEVVAPPADRLRDDDAGTDRVEQRERVEVPAPGEDHHGEQAAAHRAPDREAALPDLERAGDPALAPLVSGEQVVNARADDAGDHDRHRDLGDDLRVVPGAPPADVGDLGRDEHADREHQAVGVQLQRPDVHDPVRRARDVTQHRRGILRPAA